MSANGSEEASVGVEEEVVDELVDEVMSVVDCDELVDEVVSVVVVVGKSAMIFRLLDDMDSPKILRAVIFIE